MSRETFCIESEVDAELAEMESNYEQRAYLEELIRVLEYRLEDIPEEE